MKDLLERTARLMAVPSVSHAEGPLVDAIESELRSRPHLETTRVGDNLVARTNKGRARRVIFAGHTDTVPPDGNEAPRTEGDSLWGRGAADMKGALAVYLDLAETFSAPAVDVTYVFYAREEVAAAHSGLEELFVARPDLLVGEAAIIGEPTSAKIEAGCQGTFRLAVTLRGVRAHTARAWMGRNAIHRLGGLLAALSIHVPRQPLVGGLRFHEALQAVAVSGGVAGNVVPDSATVTINGRFAPDLDAEQAVAAARAVIEPFVDVGDDVKLLDVAMAAPPGVEHPLLRWLVDDHRLEVGHKLGWTDVARFAARGIPAVNFGPGDPALAHTRDEFVTGEELRRVRAILASLLDGTIRIG